MSVLPHKRELIAFLPISDLYTEYADHERLRVFANKGLECVGCNHVGTFLIISRETSKYKESRQRNSVGSVHVDVYTDDFTMMTVDHIVPRAVCKQLGWTSEQIEHLDNKQPMCYKCNSKKSDNLVTAPRFNREKRTVEGVIGELIPNIHRLLGDPV